MFERIARPLDSQNAGDKHRYDGAGVLANTTSDWLNKQVEGLDDCPLRIFNANRFYRNAKEVQGIARGLATRFGVGFDVSYSVKTDPSAEVLGMALDAGLDAECISLAELGTVQAHGFDGGACVLNGPGKWWPRRLLGLVEEPAVVNCDSLHDLRKTMGVLEDCGWDSCVLGVRVEAPGTQSRFGVNVGDSLEAEVLRAELNCIPEQRRLGIHFHYAQSVLGTNAWVESVTRAAWQASSAFGSASQRVEHFDLGGGWSAGDFEELKEGLAKACDVATECFGELRSFAIEPGKMLVEDCGLLACRVLGRRGAGDCASVVVSAAICDAPDVVSYAHDVIWRKAEDGPWRRLDEGHGCVLGRLCMESDVLRRGITVPDGMAEGDMVVICGTGAYDTSMAFPFGDGSLYTS